MLEKSKLAMRAIAEWSIRRSFALAKADSRRFIDDEFFRLQSRAFVRAITERAVTRSATRAPPVGSWLKLHFYRFGISGYWSVGHEILIIR